ncbi:hypothetical protein FQR65_LT12390 [Abscondita terminalis]|nr:hypothetical protein FQR65_LT12390 [Abscondita terminalis]
MNKLLVLFLVVGASCALKLPAEFEKCKRSDPNINECLKSAIQSAMPVLAKGLPEFNFDSIKPVKVPSLTIGEGTGAVHVVQNYKNLEIHNLETAKIESVKSTITDDVMKIEANLYFDAVTVEADYNLDGNILVFPIKGDGKCTLSLKNCKVTMDIEGEMFTKKEQPHVQVKDFIIKLDPGKVEFDFKNLFNGDAKLGDEMNKLLNDNWSDVFVDVKSGYEDALSAIFKNIANLIFKKIPYNEIFEP